LNDTILLLLAALSGLCLSIIGIAFRIGQNRGVIPLHISMFMGLAGAIFFGVQMDWSQFGEIGFFVWGMALLTTLGQIVAMHLVKIALSKGPLSPLWAAMNLTFLPVIIYSAVVFTEPVTAFQVAAILAGVLCVTFAAYTQRGESSPKDDKPAQPSSSRVTYALLLVAILLGNSLVFIVIKDLGTRPVSLDTALTFLVAYTGPIYFIMYLSLGLFSGLTAVIQKAKPRRMGDLIWIGMLAAAGSISGLLLLKVCVPLPAGVVFTINGVTTILGGALASVLFFREKVFWGWYGTVGFGVLAVLLANLDSLL
jgi:drug/metabolite transporter (DMT)-like permease